MTTETTTGTTTTTETTEGKRSYRVLYDRAWRSRATTTTTSDAGAEVDDDDDSYTDRETFLSRTRVNANVRMRSFASSALCGLTISQQCAVVVMHACAHVGMKRNVVDVEATARRAAAAALSWACAAAFARGRGDDASARSTARVKEVMSVVWQSVRVGALTTCGLAALAPLCQTMTATMSSDTAHVCACLSLITYAITYDYGFVNLETKQLASSFSLGAAMFASLLLASRFDDARASFVDMLLALESYVLSPYVWRAVRSFSAKLHVLVIVLMHIAAFLAVRAHDEGLAFAYAAGALALGVGAPALLVRSVARSKTQIAGPWDEALPSLYLFRNTERASGVPRFRHYVANKIK